MYSMDDFLRLQGPIAIRRSETARQKAGVLTRPRTMDIEAFLAACGLRGKQKPV